jgi:hypothetical protein
MAINGVACVIFSADDPNNTIRFFEDFGLTGQRHSDGADFMLPEGSSVLVRQTNDSMLPPAFLKGDSPREVIWGVDSTASLTAIEQDLRKDFEVSKDSDGTIHLADPNGLRVGFRVFERKPLEPVQTQENSQTHRPRWNTVRKQYERARPKVIQHVVFAVPDIDKAIAFYVNRLGFRVSDVIRGRGVFLRPEGRNEHHSLFLVNQPLGFHHMAFGLDSIDELMVGANHMQRQGWASKYGLGRHRVSSIVFYYMTCPAGGEIEYTADGDYIDDNWEPGLWEPIYSNQYWMAGDPAPVPPGPIVKPLSQPIFPFSDLK